VDGSGQCPATRRQAPFLADLRGPIGRVGRNPDPGGTGDQHRGPGRLSSGSYDHSAAGDPILGDRVGLQPGGRSTRSPLLGTGMEMLAGSLGAFIVGLATGEAGRLDLGVVSSRSLVEWST